MFGLFRKQNKKENAFPFRMAADMHSHLLPGIDDGAPDVDTSIELIKGLMDFGIRKVVTTPHIISDMYRNSPDTIFPALKLVQDELKARGIDFGIRAAAEYMLDSYFMELLENKSVLLTVKDNLILTEFSFSSMPSSPEKMSFAIITEGYTPILAHPERYPYYFRDFSGFNRLQELGYLLQVNLLSLTGYYGKDVQKAAQYIIKNDLASFVGTDLHHQRHLDALHDPRNRAIFDEWLGGREWNEGIS